MSPNDTTKSPPKSPPSRPDLPTAPGFPVQLGPVQLEELCPEPTPGLELLDPDLELGEGVPEAPYQGLTP